MASLPSSSDGLYVLLPVLVSVKPNCRRTIQMQTAFTAPRALMTNTVLPQGPSQLSLSLSFSLFDSKTVDVFSPFKSGSLFNRLL